MLTLLRILFTGAWIFLFLLARQNAIDHPNSGDLMNAFYLAAILAVGLAVGAVWTPYFADVLCGPLLGTISEIPQLNDDSRLRRLTNWALRHRHRRLVLFLCCVDGLFHPDLPRPFLTGMHEAKPGSRLERIFAREVFRFENAVNCAEAEKVLDRHGIKPGRHWSVSINYLLTQRKMVLRPPADVIALPRHNKQVPVPRNPKIKLFRRAGSTNSKVSPATPAGPRGTQKLPVFSKSSDQP